MKQCQNCLRQIICEKDYPGKWQQISRQWYTLRQLAAINWFILMTSGVSNTKIPNAFILNVFRSPQLTFTCSKSTIETAEKDVKYVQS